MSAIIPAILPRSARELEDSLARLARAPFVQIDVVDGRMAVPVALLSHRHFEVDLMVPSAEQVAGEWLAAGASRLTLHLESLEEPARTLARIKQRYGHESDTVPRPFELGLALGIETDLALLDAHIAHIDYVQLMGIRHIGHQGEPFDERVIGRVRTLHARYPRLTIQVDGGATLATVPELLAAGASRLIVGHAITEAPDADVALASFDVLVKQEPHAHEHRATSTHPKRTSNADDGEGALTDADIQTLEVKANEIRQTIIEMLVAAGSGHTAGPLGMADIFTAFYFHILKHDPKSPEWAERDRLILSNGHIVPVRYATMAHAGYFPIEECLTLRKFGSRLQGHPERLRLPGLETTSGPLGEGLSQAAGIAYALRMDAKGFVNPSLDEGFTKPFIRPRVYCVMSDGEQEEGNTWEAAMFAGKYKLSNLTAVMDRNNIQIDGMTEDIMPLEPLADKYRAFNWHVLEVNGHDIRAFVAAVEEAQAIYEKPTLIIAHTIPGKGVPEIEFDYHWHGKPPSKEEGARFLKEIRSMGGRVPHEYA